MKCLLFSDLDFEKKRFVQDRVRPYQVYRVSELLEEQFREHILALGYPEATGRGIVLPPYSSPCLNPYD
ncbi:hypothetical protein TNIN_357701 [Trichonephila inaurata madagascariensis]|uniref:Uncharacterized protein n=1 Tax=Trichonephila inaurata madagascariensis TaxID=2747483 RepID=A0A8X6IUB5_9ARAC|nr:hypothetical protein TNIN_357701 [Trichonephila inaurata madagascariensis]